jgi:hypothetical protein
MNTTETPAPFLTYADAKNGRHIPGVTSFLCSCCHHVKPTPEGCGTGYAVYDPETPAPRMVCYDCADNLQREELRDRSKPVCAYVSGDGIRITTWTGGHLMTVTRSTPCSLTRQSFTHSRKSYRTISAKDVHGGSWYGRGSPGIAIRLRPCKD